jgi:hypothetical protein
MTKESTNIVKRMRILRVQRKLRMKQKVRVSPMAGAHFHFASAKVQKNIDTAKKSAP